MGEGMIKKTINWIKSKKESRRFFWRFAFSLRNGLIVLTARRNKRILITGCGRSGTQYTAALLTEMGLPLGHEKKVSRFGVASWRLAVRVKPSSLIKIGKRTYHFTVILHQVRDPIKVIRSMHTASEGSWSKIQKYIPVSQEDSLLLKCMKYWYYWNLEAEDVSCWTYRVEDFYNVFEMFCEKIGHPELIEKKSMILNVPTNMHTREHKPVFKNMYKEITWRDLEEADRNLCLKIKQLAKKYGYQTD